MQTETIYSPADHPPKVEQSFYEQPLNETIRLFLQLDYQLQAIFEKYQINTEHASLITIEHIAKTLSILERPDLKSKITQSLTQHATTLNQVAQFDNVNTAKLNQILSKLDTHIEYLHQHQNKLCQTLRENSFLQHLKLQSCKSCGICRNELPRLGYWLKKPFSSRQKDLLYWCNELLEVHSMITLILNLLRKSSNFTLATTHNGFYQQTLNPTLPCDLLCISLPSNIEAFPEFGFGRHRLTIRFLSANDTNNNPIQLKENFDFHINLCKI